MKLTVEIVAAWLFQLNNQSRLLEEINETAKQIGA